MSNQNNSNKTPAHVRIGRIKTEIEKFMTDADEAKHLMQHYKQEGNEIKTVYWESQYEYATRTVVRMASAFNIPIERPVLQAQ